MNDKENIKARFDEARLHEADIRADQMNEAERQRLAEIGHKHEQLRADEVDRYEVDGPLERLGERNRILLEQASPELRPDGVRRKPVSFEQVCALAEDICARRHQARVDEITANEERQIGELQKEVSERITREREQACSQDLSDGFNREADASAPDSASSRDNDFGGFYRGSSERDDGRDR